MRAEDLIQFKYRNEHSPFSMKRALLRDVHEKIAYGKGTNERRTAKARDKGRRRFKVGFPPTGSINVGQDSISVGHVSTEP
jgi:hypothetical protein